MHIIQSTATKLLSIYYYIFILTKACHYLQLVPIMHILKLQLAAIKTS